VGHFIWQEIKNLLENPQKIYSYSPFIMYMIKKVTGTKFPSDVHHKPLRPLVSKNPRIPSPEAPEEEEHEIGEEGQHVQHETAARGGTSLTDHPNWSDWSHQGQHSHAQRPSSPIKKLIKMLVGMCKSQRDIEVEQKRQCRPGKKERDSIKMMHNAMNPQPPRSPISPSPLEVDIPSVPDRI